MPPPPPFSSPLLDLLDNTVRGHAGAVAVADDRGHLTYERLWSAAAHTAARLTGAGLAGRPVLLALPPGTGWVTGLLGAWRAGSAAVPLDLT
ncbi:AMP-binding protein, partial [Streptomyces clavuligerus]